MHHHSLQHSSHSSGHSWSGSGLDSDLVSVDISTLECVDISRFNVYISNLQVTVMGARGRGRGEFLNPQGVAVTLKGDLLVTDSNNQNVQMFTRSVIIVMVIVVMTLFRSSGVFIQRWGTRGRFPGQLQRPTGITLNKVTTSLISTYL